MYERKDRNYYRQLNQQEVLHELLLMSIKLGGHDTVGFDFDYIPRGMEHVNGVDCLIGDLSTNAGFISGRSKAISALNDFLDHEYEPEQHGLGFLHVAFDAIQKCVNQRDNWILELPDTLDTCSRLFEYLNSDNVQTQIADMRGGAEYIHFINRALQAFGKQLSEVKRIAKQRHLYFSGHDPEKIGKYDFDDFTNPFLASYATFLSFVGGLVGDTPHCDIPTQLFECQTLSNAFNDMVDPDLSYYVYGWKKSYEIPYDSFIAIIEDRARVLMDYYVRHYDLKETDRNIGTFKNTYIRRKFNPKGDYIRDAGGRVISTDRQMHMNFGREEEARLAYCDSFPHLARRLNV